MQPSRDASLLTWTKEFITVSFDLSELKNKVINVYGDFKQEHPKILLQHITNMTNGQANDDILHTLSTENFTLKTPRRGVCEPKNGRNNNNNGSILL
ncbi:unnamed protein product [Hermetia illucens]|uniref:Uncharacterized protein n=1 Tax=Hermetia illucens TaxID=343691 RepID=A0A7R8YXQ4_HERIL|nr:unnamed protein product [Hermetia illucens]